MGLDSEAELTLAKPPSKLGFMLQLICWVILAAIHALPALALFHPSSLTTLYGIQPDNPLFLLMQHRAALFLAVFAACLWAAFVPEGRRLAVVVVSISMIGFLVLYWQAGAPAPLKRIAWVDMAGLPVLALAAFYAFRTAA